MAASALSGVRLSRFHTVCLGWDGAGSSLHTQPPFEGTLGPDKVPLRVLGVHCVRPPGQSSRVAGILS